jgi:hypothetical protein
LSEATPPKPPPRSPPPANARPDAEARSARLTEPPPSLSTAEKQTVALQALGLLNEQIQARIVHYRGDLETSPELDAITAQVVAQLKAMQTAMGRKKEARRPPEEIEAEQVRILTALLTKLVSPEGQRNFVTQTIKPIGRRIAKLFFESELHEKSKGDKDKVIHHAEQGVYYVLQRYKNRLRNELQGFEYIDQDIRELTLQTLAKIERDLQVAFLSRRSPELNLVMTIYAGVLTEFLQTHLPTRLEQMAKVTIRNAKTAHRNDSVGYKIHAEAFGGFRAEWERLLIQQMVHYCGDELLVHLHQSDQAFRDETVRFFTDPHVFSETAMVLCDALYDFLCLEGFLDLPMDWRVSMGTRDE